jgi:capsule polysaccharide modification protein KpsS
MALDGALFCPANSSQHYTRDCLLMMQCLIEPFQSPQLEDIQQEHPSTFDGRGIITLDGTVDQQIKHFLWNTEAIDVRQNTLLMFD